MSSAAPAATPDGADSGPGPATASAAGGLHDPSTFWCYECDMSVALVFSSPPLRCPHCGGDFLEEMEEPRRSPPHAHFRRRRLLLPGEVGQPGPDQTFGSDDDFDAMDELEDAAGAQDDEEVFDRLFNRIVSSLSEEIGRPVASVDSGGARGASKSAVEAMPTVQITEAFLAADPCLICAVCKEEFALQTEARLLPCRHIYHPGCILPWLSQHNSCPLCRFLLPTEEEERRRTPNGNDRPHVVLGNLLDAMDEDMARGRHDLPREVVLNLLNAMDEEVDRDMREMYDSMRTVFPEYTYDPEEVDDDLREIQVIMRRMAGRRRTSFSRRPRLSAAAASSPAQLVQRGIGSGVLANDPDRVSSRNPRDEVTTVGGSGTDAGGRVDEEGDVVISEARARGLRI